MEQDAGEVAVDVGGEGPAPPGMKNLRSLDFDGSSESLKGFLVTFQVA